MRDGKLIFVIFVSILIALLLISFVNGFFHKDEPRLAPFNTSVTIGNRAPKIILTFNVTDFVSASGIVTPVPNSTVEANVSFIVEDANGGGDINLKGGRANYTFAGINRSSQTCFAPTTCPACPNPARQRNFTCSVLIQHYDVAAIRGWVVNVSVNDTSGARAENSTTNFTMASTTAFAIISDPPSVTWSSISIDINNQSANNNLSLKNIGNFPFISGSIRAFELNGSVTPTTQHIYPENFSVSSDYLTIPFPECDISGIHGNRLTFDVDVPILGLGLPRSTDTTIGLENATFCIYANLSTVNLDPTQTYSSISRDWRITLP